jgi:hypothetical protein
MLVIRIDPPQDGQPYTRMRVSREYTAATVIKIIDGRPHVRVEDGGMLWVHWALCVRRQGPGDWWTRNTHWPTAESIALWEESITPFRGSDDGQEIYDPLSWQASQGSGESEYNDNERASTDDDDDDDDDDVGQEKGRKSLSKRRLSSEVRQLIMQRNEAEPERLRSHRHAPRQFGIDMQLMGDPQIGQRRVCRLDAAVLTSPATEARGRRR